MKDKWANELKSDPIILNRADYTKYMKDIQTKMSTVLNTLNKNQIQSQNKYISEYNKSTVSKVFVPDDKVLVLQPDSTHKHLSQWIGPVSVVSRVRENSDSYRILFPNGGVKIVHADQLRSFITDVKTVGVVFEDEEDFGDIVFTPDTCVDQDPLQVHEKFKDLDLSHLNPKQQRDLLSLLQKHVNVFSDKTGFCDLYKHRIELKKGYEPKSFKPYRIPETLKQEVGRQIDNLLAEGKIQESDTPWVHPIVCVIKPDKSVRMCVNYKYVNAGTIQQPYYLSRVDDILRKVSSKNYITSLDCNQGYYQQSMSEESKKYTGFICHKGVFTWNVLPFGLSMASQSYSRMMDKVLHKHKEFTDVYIDDVAVSSMTFQSHLSHLDKVLSSIGTAGITLKLKKCAFAKPKTQLLGFNVGSGETTVVRAKADAIQQLSPPTTKKLLKSFLGVCSFFRAYIPNFAEIAYPLTELTKQKQSTKIVLNSEEMAAFVKLKNLIGSPPVLISPDYEQPFFIFCDASEKGTGCVLLQKSKGEEFRPIAYASKKFNPTQTRWSVIEREAYGVIFALQQFEVIVFGCEIILFSDHNPLQFLTECVPKSSKLTRWMLAIQRFNISIQHVAGNKNLTADILSRL